MKRILPLLLALLCLKASLSQEYKTTYRAVTFMSNQSFYLNGGTHAAFGGKSRVIYPIELPANTVEWYYAITTTPNEHQTVSIGLASQILKIMDPSFGMGANALASLVAPTGAGVVDIYLLHDQPTANAFLSKQMPFQYLPTGSRENYRQGVVQIKDNLQGPFILGFKNPSLSTGIAVNLEVVAIVAEETLIEKSDARKKAELYGNLGWKAYQSGDYDKCLEYSQKSYQYDSTIGMVQCDMGIVYLIKGSTQATDTYIQAIEWIKKSQNPERVLGLAIQQIDDTKKKFGVLKDADLIRGLLADEYKKYHKSFLQNLSDNLNKKSN